MHFQPYEIIQTKTEFDSKSGKHFTVSLQMPKLKSGSIPLLFLNCPKHLSKQAAVPRASKESLFKKRRKIIESA